MGKEISLSYSAMGMAMPIGLIIAGPVTEMIGINNWFIISGLVIVLV